MSLLPLKLSLQTINNVLSLSSLLPLLCADDTAIRGSIEFPSLLLRFMLEAPIHFGIRGFHLFFSTVMFNTSSTYRYRPVIDFHTTYSINLTILGFLRFNKDLS